MIELRVTFEVLPGKASDFEQYLNLHYHLAMLHSNR